MSEHRRAQTDTNLSVFKVNEPHPEPLMIEPVSRPSLVSSIPPDWAIEGSAPQFAHSKNLENSESRESKLSA